MNWLFAKRLRPFVLLAGGASLLLNLALLMPALAIATVGSYGLTVWIYQMIAGPPGPPAAH